jgi:hypothetical protein
MEVVCAAPRVTTVPLLEDAPVKVTSDVVVPVAASVAAVV